MPAARLHGPLTPRFGSLLEPRQRAGALLLELARGALAARPHALVQGLHVIEELRVVGDDAELEVAAAAALRAEAGAGPVRAAEVEQLAVDDHRLHVHARAAPQLQAAGDEARMVLQLGAKRSRWQLR